MIAYGAVLADLEERVRPLPARATAAIFSACSQALLPEARAWAEHWGEPVPPVLEEALAAARRFAISGTEPAEPSQLLDALGRHTPPGDSPDYFSSLRAQDCWTCAYVGIRVISDPRYKAGLAIEYALEPIVSMATHELFGCAQVGSGLPEKEQAEAVLAHSQVAGGISFFRWVCEFLSNRSALSEANLTTIEARAQVLAPRPFPVDRDYSQQPTSH